METPFLDIQIRDLENFLEATKTAKYNKDGIRLAKETLREYKAIKQALKDKN